MKEYKLKSNINCDVEVIVIAESREDADRLLNNTIDNITLKDLKEKLSRCKDVEIIESNVKQRIYQKERDMER